MYSFFIVILRNGEEFCPQTHSGLNAIEMVDKCGQEFSDTVIFLGFIEVVENLLV